MHLGVGLTIPHGHFCRQVKFNKYCFYQQFQRNDGQNTDWTDDDIRVAAWDSTR